MKKRILSLLCIAVLCMSLMAGCGGGTQNSAAPESGNTEGWVPTEDIELTVGNDAGGGADLFARKMVEIIGKYDMCPVNITVVNKPAGMRGHYINCGGSKRGSAVCPGRSKTITLEQIEGAVEARLLHFLKSYRAIPLQVPQRRSTQVNKLEIAIVQHEQTIRQLTQNLAHIREPDVIHIISAQIHEENDELHACTEQRDALLYQSQPADLEPFFAAVLTEWPSYTIAEKKLIAKAAIADPTFRTITATRTHTIPATNKNVARPIANHHQFIRKTLNYDGCIGGKTGYTDVAITTLVTYARRGDMTLICVVMNCGGQDLRFYDCINLFEMANQKLSAQ